MVLVRQETCWAEVGVSWALCADPSHKFPMKTGERGIGVSGGPKEI